MILQSLNSRAQFSPQKMGKTTLAQGETLFAGLNSFEAGQEHAPHAHPGQDKLYVVIQGTGQVQIGDQASTITVGDAAFAPSGVLHSIRNPGPERLVVMAILAPPPTK